MTITIPLTPSLNLNSLEKRYLMLLVLKPRAQIMKIADQHIEEETLSAALPLVRFYNEALRIRQIVAGNERIVRRSARLRKSSEHLGSVYGNL